MFGCMLQSHRHTEPRRGDIVKPGREPQDLIDQFHQYTEPRRGDILSWNSRNLAMAAAVVAAHTLAPEQRRYEQSMAGATRRIHM